MAADYDEVRSDVKESQDSSLEALKSASAPDARGVVTELDEADARDEGLTPGGEIVSEELIVQLASIASAVVTGHDGARGETSGCGCFGTRRITSKPLSGIG